MSIKSYNHLCSSLGCHVSNRPDANVFIYIVLYILELLKLSCLVGFSGVIILLSTIKCKFLLVLNLGLVQSMQILLFASSVWDLQDPIWTI